MSIVNKDDRLILEIAIPTYNRNELLRRNLQEILIQSSELAESGVVHIRIIDNSSPTPVSDSLGDMPSWVKIEFNTVNIGGNANLVRCFERCAAPWVWIVGDDDMIEKGAVLAALNNIRLNPEATAIIYAVRNIIVRESDWVTRCIDEFMQRLDNFSNLLFIPSTLYRVSAIRQYLPIGYHYGYSCAPHLAMLFSALSCDVGTAVFLKSSNINYERPEIENRGWIMPVAWGLPTLLELPQLTCCARRFLANHIKAFPSLGSLIHQTLLRRRFGGAELSNEVRHYVQALHRMPFMLAPGRRIMGIFLLPILVVPQLSYPVVALMYRLMTGHQSGQHKMPQDRL